MRKTLHTCPDWRHGLCVHSPHPHSPQCHCGCPLHGACCCCNCHLHYSVGCGCSLLHGCSSHDCSFHLLHWPHLRPLDHSPHWLCHLCCSHFWDKQGKEELVSQYPEWLRLGRELDCMPWLIKQIQ